MKKKSSVFGLLGLAIILLLAKACVAQANLDKRVDIDIPSVERLLNLRIEVMNRALFEQGNLNDIDNELNEIELEDMRNWDIEMLREARRFATDMAYVHSLKISEIREVTRHNNQYFITAMIEWDISDYDDRKMYKELYKIELIDIENRLFIKVFEPMENQ